MGKSNKAGFILFADWCDDSWRQHQSLAMRGRLFDPPPHHHPGSSVEVRPTTKKLLPGTHESLCRRDTRQSIMSAQAYARTRAEAVEADERPLTTRSQQKQSPSKRPLVYRRKKKLGEEGEINQAYSGRDNKFAAYIEYGNPICLVPHFHGKAIPFSCFQRPLKSAMISSFRSN